MQAFDINDFQLFDYHPGVFSQYPEMTINADAVLFNSASLRKLGSPTSIRLMFDPKGQRMAMQGVKKGNDTIDLLPDRKSRAFGVHTREKVKFIRDLVPGWDENTRYKVKGVYHEVENVMVYDLKDATVFKGGTYPGTKKK
jgi:hypothetical protein